MNDNALIIRPIAEKDCNDVVALFESCYGNAYNVEYFHRVDDLISEVKSGRLRSVVAIKFQKVVGHIGFIQSSPTAKVCEAGNTVIHHSVRQEGLMMKLALRLHKLILESGFQGYIHYPTTVHSVMQKASVRSGGIETGLMLGYINRLFDSKDNTQQDKSSAVTIVYQRLAESAHLKLKRLPTRYAHLIKDLYHQSRIVRQIDSQPSLNVPSRSNLNWSFNRRRQCLQICIYEIGEGLLDEISAKIDQYQPSVSYIDLAVDADGIDQAVESLNFLGFFYSGLLPHFSSTDILRLQKIFNADQVDFQPTLVNKTACQLLDYICRDARSIGVF
jgi:hypothetical protein